MTDWVPLARLWAKRTEEEFSNQLERMGCGGYFSRVMSTEILVARFRALSPAAQREVEALVRALSAVAQTPRPPRKKKRFSFNWAGGLKDLKTEFNGVELQHHLRDLR
jgi:hypothetical protein